MIILDDILSYNQSLNDCLINDIGFFDNLYHVLIVNNNITEIESFDADFNIFKDINRLN
jgi:hypothetical protein